MRSKYLGALRERGLIMGGISQFKPPSEFERPSPRFHWLAYGLGGSGELHVPRGRFQIETGQLWLVPAGRPHRYGTRDGEWDLMWFRLADEEQWAHLRRRRAGPIHPGWADRTRRAMETIFLETSSWFWLDTPRMLRASAETISIWLARRLKAELDTRAHRVRQELAVLWSRVDADLAHPWRAEELAEAMSCSVPQLHRYTARHNGASPMNMVKRLRMNRAEELLLNSDAPLKHIAAVVGYETPFSFSKAFKRHAGCSPREFRRREAGRRRRPVRRR
jgi:AraC-like DNA-binding protein